MNILGSSPATQAMAEAASLIEKYRVDGGAVFWVNGGQPHLSASLLGISWGYR